MFRRTMKRMALALVLEGMLGLALIVPMFSVFDDIVHRATGTPSPVESASTGIGYSENGLLVEQWNYTLLKPVRYSPLLFGSSPAIADLGADVNTVGGEPIPDLEIVTGSAEYNNFYPELNKWAHGIWRVFDSYGNVEWAKDTETDQSMSSPALMDIDVDGDLEIAGGTTSGWNVEVMNHTGGFVWTFPYPPEQSGDDLWHSSPAIADLNASVSGLEVVIGNNPYGSVWAFDGDNTDGIDDGITVDISGWGYPGPIGIEGEDWDVLWVFQTDWLVVSSPSVGDVDNDNQLEVIIGSLDSCIYCLNGANGTLEWSYETGGSVYSSAGLADFDIDGDLEVVIGSADGSVYFINSDENNNGTIDSNEVVSYSTYFLFPIFSSPAIGDVDGDGNFEAIIGGSDGNVYSFDYNPSTNTVTLNWATPTDDSIYSSPALVDRTSVQAYERDWPMFRHDARRTGFYGTAPPTGLDIFIGSDDHYLYFLRGKDGDVIDRFLTYGSVRTSPGVADVHGESTLNIFFYDHGYDSAENDIFWALAYLPVHNLDTDLRYSTIQRAIDAPETLDEHTIRVYAGRYNENVDVYKSLSIIGEEVSATIVNAMNPNDDVFNVTVSHANISGFTIQNGRNGVAFRGFGNSTLRNCNIKNNNIIGIGLWSSNNNTINGNAILNNDDGVRLYNSNNNTIGENVILSNEFDGVSLSGDCHYNIIENNNVTYNSRAVVLAGYSSNNIVGNNNVTNNNQGLYLSTYSRHNTIYHNSFISNNEHAVIRGPKNVWDDGYPFGGNYWSNYTGIDLYSGPFQNETGSDGIGDTSHTVYPAWYTNPPIHDRYPLMNPYTTPPPTPSVLFWITRTEGGETEPLSEQLDFPVIGYSYWYTEGATVLVTASPDAGYKLDRWELDGVDREAVSPMLVLMNTNHRLHTVFTLLIHDVAVTSVSSSHTSVTQGQTVTITVVVTNQGEDTESFSVSTYFDGYPIDSQNVANLSPGAFQTLYFYWHTYVSGSYLIRATAGTVPGETDTADNTKIDGTVKVDPPPPSPLLGGKQGVPLVR